MRKTLGIIAIILSIALAATAGYFAGLEKSLTTPVAIEFLEALSSDVRPQGLDMAKVETLINTERSKNGLSPLTASSALSKSTCGKVDHMVANNYWSHDAPDGTEPWSFFDAAGYHYRNAGENLAYGQTTEKMLVNGWMNSPLHKANILGDFQEHGLCSKTVKFQGGYYNLTVHHFGTSY